MIMISSLMHGWKKPVSLILHSYDKIIFSYHGVPNSHVDNVYPDTLCEDNDCEE